MENIAFQMCLKSRAKMSVPRASQVKNMKVNIENSHVEGCRQCNQAQCSCDKMFDSIALKRDN
jgi:hypothetical protein